MKSLNIKSLTINSLLLSSIIFNSSTLSLIVQFLIFIIFIFLNSKFTFSLGKLFFVHIVFISLLFNLEHIQNKDLIRLIQIFIAFLFLPLNVDKSTISKKMLGLIMLFIAFMTISNVLGLGFETSFKNYFYPIDSNPWSSDNIIFGDSVASVLFNRYATFYYNPNILGQTTLLILVIYLTLILDKKMNIFDVSVFLSGVLCLIVSGGRTSFLIFSIIVFLTIVWKVKLFYRILFLFTVVPVILIKLSESRLLQIVNNDENMDSVGLKFSILDNYLKTFEFDFISIYKFFYGTLKSDIQFDNDIGSIFYFSGFFSILYFVIYFFLEFFSSNNKYKPFYTFALVSISATIIFNFKFLILTIVILSILRKKDNLHLNVFR